MFLRNCESTVGRNFRDDLSTVSFIAIPVVSRECDIHARKSYLQGSNQQGEGDGLGTEMASQFHRSVMSPVARLL